MDKLVVTLVAGLAGLAVIIGYSRESGADTSKLESSFQSDVQTSRSPK